MLLLLLLTLAVSFVSSFVPPEQVLRVRSIRSPAYDIPPKGIWGDHSPFVYNSVVGTDAPGTTTTTNYFGTIPPPQGNLLLVPTAPVATTPLPPLDLAKHFVQLSQKQLKSIQVQGPSLEDLFEKTKTVRSILRGKEQLFQEILGKQRDEYDEVKRQFNAWQAYYNSTLDSLQSKTEQQEEDMASQTFLHETQMKQLQTKAEQQEKKASEKILWLTNQMQELKLEAHKKQVEMTQLSQEKHAELQQRVAELQSRLEQQIRLTETETSKYKDQMTKRNELELELTQVRAEFQIIVQQLEGQLSAEQAARAEERRHASEQLESERVTAQQALQTAQQELQKQKTVLLEGLQAKDTEHGQIVKQLQTQAQARESELTTRLESARTQQQEMETKYQKQLESVKESVSKVQTSLLARIKEKEVEMERLQSFLAAGEETARENEMHNQTRLDLEQQLTGLKKYYENSVSTWEARYKSLQQELVREKSEAQATLAKEREEAQLQIDAANKKVEESKEALDSGLEAKQAQFNQALQELRDVSAEAETDLKARLRQLSEALQEHKLNTHKKLEEEKKASVAKQNELRSIITKKEKEIQEQVSRTKKETTRAADYWQSRMELESELSSLKAHHLKITQSWERRFLTLEQARSKEKQAASSLLAKKESEARLQMKQVQNELDSLKASMETGLHAKDKMYTKQIRELNMAAIRKEKELTDNLERLSNDLQQLKLESHKKLIEEKDASTKVQQDLLARIAAKERELEESNKRVEIQSERATEFLQKRIELEEELALISKKYDSTFGTWEQMAQSFQDARLQEREALVNLLAQKKAERRQKGTSEVDEDEALFKARDRQFGIQIQELRDASKQKELALCRSIESLSQQLQNLKFESHKTQMADRQASSKIQGDLVALIESKDRELELQRQQAARHAEEAEQVGRKQLEMHRAISDLKQQHVQAIASSNARYEVLVHTREQERQVATRKLSQLESEARAKIDDAVSMAQKYQTVMTASLEKVSRMESYLQSEIDKLQIVVADTSRLCSSGDMFSDAI